MKRPKPFMAQSETRRLHKYFMASLPLNGDIAECGIGFGGTSRRLILWTKEEGYDKMVHMFDSLMPIGMPNMSTPKEIEMQIKCLGKPYNFEGFNATLESVTNQFNGLGLTGYKIYPGLVTDTLPKFDKPLCFIHGDVDLYVNMKAVGEMAERVLVSGGHYVAHDYGGDLWFGVKQSIDELLQRGKFEMVESTSAGRGQCVLRKI